VELLKKLNHVYNLIFLLCPALTFVTQPNISAIYDFESYGEQLYVTGFDNVLPLRHSGRHIFLELATGGDLFSYMVKNGTLCEGEAKFISYQLMKGLEVWYSTS
jgi:serine/threonine protein kinase